MPKTKSTGSTMPDTSGWTVNTFRSVSDRQFYFNIRAANGEIVAASEGYKTKLKRDRMALTFAGAFGVSMKEAPAPEPAGAGIWPFPTAAALKDTDSSKAPPKPPKAQEGRAVKPTTPPAPARMRASKKAAATA